MVILMTGCGAKDSFLEPAKHIPIQHNGRVKSFDSFSRQTLEFVAGSENWRRKPAIVSMLDLLSKPEQILTVQWIRVDYPELKRILKLESGRHFFSGDEIAPGTAKLESLVRAAKEKRDKDIRPTKLEQKAETLYSRFNAVNLLRSGQIVRVVPPASGYTWSSVDERFRDLLNAYAKNDSRSFQDKAESWNDLIYSQAGRDIREKIRLEVIYFRVRPFECAAVGYLVAFLPLSFFKKRKLLAGIGLAAFAGAVLFHTAGLGLRMAILSRPPVSNMYESMVFMNWAVILFAVLFALIRKNTVAVSAGAFVSAFVMLYANLLPIDASLDVLVPVLRSNYWLTIHVLTVVSSYGAFGLAMALGHRHLILSLTGKFSPQKEEESAGLIYRVIQVGVILIGIGTVLGGVWANESWGRFWGWDPKETWALITFLGYLVIVHLKATGRLSHFMLAIGSILGFLLVLMTWYGVNFVLGRGLHSYGAGTGGMQWVIYYLVAETLFLVWALFKNRFA
jgi:cytochrome c-type biogenesis protein CcsB